MRDVDDDCGAEAKTEDDTAQDDTLDRGGGKVTVTASCYVYQETGWLATFGMC